MSAGLSCPGTENLPALLRDLLLSEDGPAFEQALDALVRQREQCLFRALGRLTRDLHEALRHLTHDLAQDGASHLVADVRQHLQAVLEMSAQAANRSLDLVEHMRPQAAALASSAQAMLAAPWAPDSAVPLARQALEFADASRSALADMMLAQSWQDLSGQRINKVAAFVGTVESSMLELVRLTGVLAGTDGCAEVAQVSSQADADRLLNEFGF